MPDLFRHDGFRGGFDERERGGIVVKKEVEVKKELIIGGGRREHFDILGNRRW